MFSFAICVAAALFHSAYCQTSCATLAETCQWRSVDPCPDPCDTLHRTTEYYTCANGIVHTCTSDCYKPCDNSSPPSDCFGNMEDGCTRIGVTPNSKTCGCGNTVERWDCRQFDADGNLIEGTILNCARCVCCEKCPAGGNKTPKKLCKDCPLLKESDRKIHCRR